MLLYADIVSATEEDGVVVVGFVGNEASPDCYILLQRTLTPSERDKALGLDNAHLEVNGQQNSGYCTIHDPRVSPGSLRFKIAPVDAEKSGVDQVFEVLFNIDDDQFSELSAALGLIVGRSC